MNYSNELKVGLALVAAAILFFVGFRFFQDLPLFRSNYELQTQLGDAGGLAVGNAVRISGVRIGSVESIRLDEQKRNVLIGFSVDRGVTIREGASAKATGIGALGGVQLTLVPGQPSAPPLEPGSVLPSAESGDVLSELSERGPQLLSRTDSVLAGANVAVDEASQLFSDPDSDLRQTLQGLNAATTTLSRLLQNQEASLARTLANADTAAQGLSQISRDLSAFTGENGDSLGAAVKNLNRVLTRLDRNLAGLETTTQNLGAITAKIDRGEGTLGKLVNDDGLYLRLDSSATRFNSILADFEERPGRYLRDLTILELF